MVAVVVWGWLLGCMGLFGSQPLPEDLAVARQQLADGQLPEATTSFKTLFDAHPNSTDAASGYAYTLMLAGRTDEADAVLATLDYGRSSEIALRRALLARRVGNFDGVRDHGLRSGTDAGKIMAAEVQIIDLELDQATATLNEVASGASVEAATAREYLALLQNEDSIYRTLANPVALWSLGKRQDACEGAEILLRKLPADARRSELLLLWAGRAVTSGQPRIARSMVEEAVGLPPELKWREQATLAMIDIAEGNAKSGIAIFDRLLAQKKGVPADGLDDARVTACALATDPTTAQRLVRGLNSPGAARCLLQAGAVEAARTRTAPNALGRMLENL